MSEFLSSAATAGLQPGFLRNGNRSASVQNGFSVAEVRAELKRVLAFADFAASQHLTNFLRFVVDESLAGRAPSLKERTVALRAIGRDADFDPRLDCIVRVVAGKLRRTLERYYATLGASNPLSIVVRPGSYAPEFRRNDSLPAGARFAPATPRDRSPHLNSATGECPRVAVIPFSLLTLGAEERLFADLVADGATVGLSRISWLEVVDFAVRSPDAILQQSRAVWAGGCGDFTLAGTACRIGDCFYVSVRLIDARRGVVAWAEHFDVPLSVGQSRLHESIVDRIVTRVGDLFVDCTNRRSANASRPTI